MSDYEVKVLGGGPPRKPDGPLKKLFAKARLLVRALFMRPRIVSGIAATAFVLTIGTPHAGWDYQCRYRTSSGDPCRSVVYCAYYGLQGRRVVFPPDGQSCQIVTFLPLDWAQLIGGSNA